jgi:Carboxypeptidase regulatory-like domain
MDRRRAMLRASGLTAVTVLTLVVATALAPAALAANRLNVDVTLPNGFQISGRITNASGIGLGGVAVSAAEVMSFSDNASTTTSDTGNYLLRGLEPGTYRIQITPAGTTNYRSGYYRNAAPSNFTDADAAATNVVVGPSKTGIDVKVPTGYTISGRITNTSGTAIAGATARAFGTSVRSALTNAAGAYTIRGLAAGSYQIGLTPPAGSDYQYGYYAAGNANHFVNGIASATPVSVGPSKTGVDAHLPAAFTIRGRITNAAGAGLSGVGVTASGPSYVIATTDAAGDYIARGLNPGDYMLMISPPPTLNHRDGYYTSAGGTHYTDHSSAATLVHVGPSKAAINVVLPVGYTIAGKITNAAGVAIPGAVVSVYSAADGQTGATDGAGNYVLRGLDPGSYTLGIRPPDSTNYRNGSYTTANNARFTDDSASATAIVVGPSRTGINVRVPTGFVIGDTILGAGGVPVAGAFVRAMGPNGDEGILTDTSGRYLLQGLRAGSYRVRVSVADTSKLRNGWYRAGATGNWTATEATASQVVIGP